MSLTNTAPETPPPAAGPISPQSLALLNAKGGAGKTTISVNLAGVAGLRGWRTLLVDLDPQGNAGEILGYNQRGRSDHGATLMEAVTSRTPIQEPSIRDVRPNIDVICGGDHLDGLAEEVFRAEHEGRPSATLLRDALAPLANDYDLVVIDCPPSSRQVLTLAAVAVRFMLIPTRGSEMSNVGLRRVASVFGDVQSSHNPDLELLGVVMFDIGVGANKLRKDIRRSLNRDFGGNAPLLEAFIRSGQHAPKDMERYGLLAFEYEHLALGKDRRVSASEGSVVGLASDYQQLTVEVLTEMTRRLGGAR